MEKTVNIDNKDLVKYTRLYIFLVNSSYGK
jgi:hypothetical protein